MSHILTTGLSRPVEVADAVFISTAQCRGLRFLRRVSIPVEDRDLSALDACGRSIAGWSGANGVDFRVLEHVGGALSQVRLTGDHVVVVAAADGAAECHAAAEEITALLRQPVVPENEVEVSFWSNDGEGGGREVDRVIEVSSWASIEADMHSEAVRSQLADLFAQRAPTGGRLVLWHGEPGTGKTYALRALVQRGRSGACRTSSPTPTTYSMVPRGT